MLKRLEKIYLEHQQLRKYSLNLLPSENVLSPLSRKFLSSDMGQRYYFRDPFEGGNGLVYSYSGTKHIDEIITIGEKIAKELFSAKYVSLYPISGHQANLAILLAFTEQGDTIMVFDSRLGGYPGLDKEKLPHYLGLNVCYFITKRNEEELIDYESTFDEIRKYKPALVIYSSAHTLFPIDVFALSQVTHEVGGLFVYDGSHPLGLIAGRQFQNPLQEGADIFIAGTQKSFPGPQGGLIATNNYSVEVEKVIHFVILDNPHFHRIASLTVSLSEMKEFGQGYALQVLKNTQYLAKELFSRGFEVKYPEMGFTESHMFKLELSADYGNFVKDLEKSNIMIDSAGRIGVAEMTRYGMKEKDMKFIASLIERAYKNRDFSTIKKEVIKFREKFQNVLYC